VAEFKNCPCSGNNLARLVHPAVMAVLAAEPQHGYAIARGLGAMSMFRKKPPDPTGIYRVLKSMEEDGFVKSEWELADKGPAKRCYRLTDSGRECLAKWKETLKEYEEAVTRDEFLERETADLKETALALKDLIEELSEKIAVEFKDGIKKINAQFSEFFALMFGGGTASLSVITEVKRRRRSILEEELDLPTGQAGLEIPEDLSAGEAEEETEEGVEVKVSLPHKKIKGLMMLSGGERALTSIALLFAISQVIPPPFLVLDETDAALDEANSKKYGDMLANLSKNSQLIVVTHNRETMSRAGILYGVTMGNDAVSKLLSVKFDEATEFAK